MKSAMVTGGSRGIGLGIATRLADLGYGLTLTARREQALNSVADALRAAGAPFVQTVTADLADRETAEEVVSVHRHMFQSMDVLVLNAGVGTAGLIETYPMSRFDKTLDVNVRAPFQFLQQSMPLLREAVAHRPSNGARVLALASLTGVYSEAGLAVYGAAKAALMSLIDTLNTEESHNGISGTSIAPGYVDTDMSDWTKGKIPAENMIRVDDIAALAASVIQLSAHAVVSRLVVTRAGAGLNA